MNQPAPTTTELLEQVKLYVSVAHYELAEKTLEAHLNHPELSDQEHADLHNMLGYVHYQQSQFDRATHHYRLATKYDPTHVEALLSHVVSLCDLGEYTQANQLMHQAQIQVDKGHSLSFLTLDRLAQLHEQTGDHYQQCGQPHRALSEYQSAAGISPHQPRLTMKIAEALLNLGNTQRAHKELTNLLHHAEYSQRALCLLGIMAYQQGDLTSCATYWQELDSSAPTNSAETQRLASACRSFADSIHHPQTSLNQQPSL